MNSLPYKSFIISSSLCSRFILFNGKLANKYTMDLMGKPKFQTYLLSRSLPGNFNDLPIQSMMFKGYPTIIEGLHPPTSTEKKKKKTYPPSIHGITIPRWCPFRQPSTSLTPMMTQCNFYRFTPLIFHQHDWLANLPFWLANLPFCLENLPFLNRKYILTHSWWICFWIMLLLLGV